MEEHEGGKYPKCYTYKRRPVELVWACDFDNATDAITWERRIHGWSRKKKEALMRDDWDEIEELAKRRRPFGKSHVLRDAPRRKAPRFSSA